MNAVIGAAADLQAMFVAEGWRFCFIGGVALQRWGEPRETVDVDATLLTGFGREDQYIQKLLAVFEARIDRAAEFARTRRVAAPVQVASSGADLVGLTAIAS